MLFFTELKHRTVITQDNIVVGRLDDLVFDAKDVPNITKIVVKSARLQHPQLFIPAQFVLIIGETITIAKNYQIEALKENELFVGKNLIDKQIIDIEGNKVIRVNDAVFRQTGTSRLTIMGVDVGLLGILRWFGLDEYVRKVAHLLGKKVSPTTLPWSHIQPLELATGKVKLNLRQDKLENLHPEDLADYLELTNMDNVIQTIKLLDPDFAAEVVAELNLNYQVTLFKKIGFKKTVAILSQMDPDEVVDVLNEFTPKKRQEILAAFDKKLRDSLAELMRYGMTEVGEYMTSEFLTVDADDVSHNVIERIRVKGQDISYLGDIYVTNKSEQLIGVFNLHELITQPLYQPVRKFMIENPVTIHLHTPIKSVQRKFIKYKLSALPVVNQYKKIIGIVTFDDVAELFLNKI